MVQGKTQKEEANPLKAHPEDDPPDRPVPGPPTAPKGAAQRDARDAAPGPQAAEPEGP